MWRFIPFYWRGGSKPAALLEDKWGCIFSFAWCQYLKMQCQDPIVPATAQTEQKAAPTGKQTARQGARATPVPRGQIAEPGIPAWNARLTSSPATLVSREGREGRLEWGQMKWLCRCLQGASPGGQEAWEETWTLEPLMKYDLKILLAVLVHSHRQAAALWCSAQHSPKAGWCGLSRGCCALTWSFSAFVVGLNLCCWFLCWVS